MNRLMPRRPWIIWQNRSNLTAIRCDAHLSIFLWRVFGEFLVTGGQTPCSRVQDFDVEHDSGGERRKKQTVFALHLWGKFYLPNRIHERHCWALPKTSFINRDRIRRICTALYRDRYVSHPEAIWPNYAMCLFQTELCIHRLPLWQVPLKQGLPAEKPGTKRANKLLTTEAPNTSETWDQTQRHPHPNGLKSTVVTMPWIITNGFQKLFFFRLVYLALCNSLYDPK